MADVVALEAGERLISVKKVIGMSHVTIQQWVRWYEEGGLEELARHKSSGMKTYRQAWTAQQEAKLKQAVSEGRFWTVGEAVRWCGEALGVEAPHWFRRWGYRKMVSRPLAKKADVQAQEA